MIETTYLSEVDFELYGHMVTPLVLLVDRAVDDDVYVLLGNQMVIETPAFVQTTRVHTSVSEETKLLSLRIQMTEGVDKAHVQQSLERILLPLCKAS